MGEGDLAAFEDEIETDDDDQVERVEGGLGLLKMMLGTSVRKGHDDDEDVDLTERVKRSQPQEEGGSSLSIIQAALRNSAT